MTISWAWGLLASGEPAFFDTVLEGEWKLPSASAIVVRGAEAVAIRVEAGSVVVLSCGDGGMIDPISDDHQPPVAFESGETRSFENDSYFYLELGSGTVEFWIFNASSDGRAAHVDLEMIGKNGEGSVCDFEVCWDSPELPPRVGIQNPGSICPNCGAGCAGVRCWSP